MPPAILGETGEALEGLGLLQELQGDLGTLLWQALRDVMLWADTPPPRRKGLFAAPAAERRLQAVMRTGVDAELEVCLDTLAGVLWDSANADPDVVSLMCRRISEWAERQGAMETALAYAQAASLARPENGAAALHTGRLAARLRKDVRAETWLRRAVALARRERDWTSYCHAFVELGRLAERRGTPVVARARLLRAVRASRRHGVGEARAGAMHGLMRLAVEAGQHADAERFARLAVRAYGLDYLGVPEFLRDLGRLWVGAGQFPRALQVLRRLLPLETEPGGRMLTLALTARAAAGAGDPGALAEAWTAALSLAREHPAADERERALLELVRAATAAGDLRRAEEAGRLAAEAPRAQAAGGGALGVEPA